MGGDNAPGAIVAGSLRAHRELGVHVLLTGRPDVVRACLKEQGAEEGPGLEVVDAPDVIPSGAADPARAVRSTKGASVSVAARLVREGRADAALSAGPTGAALAAGVLEMGRLPGVSRPAITVVLPFPGSPKVLVDAGANADVRPEHLAGFAVLGSVFAEVALGLAEPRVGLLNVGEEPGKGNELVRQAFPLLEKAPIRFLGNVEGRDIPAGDVDVVVTDGFTGNVSLKLMEGFARFLMGQLLGVFSASDEARAALDVVLPGLLELREALSPEAAGGAQLLGVRGVCIIAHGSSSAEAIFAAVRVAAQTVDAGLVQRVTERLSGGGAS